MQVVLHTRQRELDLLGAVQSSGRAVQIDSSGVDAEPFAYAGRCWNPFDPMVHPKVHVSTEVSCGTIEIGRLGEALHRRMTALVSRLQVVEHLCRADVEEAEAAVDPLTSVLCDDDRFSRRIQAGRKIRAVLNVLPSGLQSTTYCSKRNKYIGLHFDDFKDHRSASVELGNVRFCVNLGTAPRYLCFVPVSFGEAQIEALKSKERYGESKLGGLAAKYCIARNPTAYRVTVEPGEYYVAPTQNLIHDGQTNNSGCNDVSLSLRFGLE